jgi:hypothetical protein
MGKEAKKLLRGSIYSFAESLFESIVLVVSVMAIGAIASLVCLKTVAPSWTAPGWPSYTSYPKNIEMKALMTTLVLTIPLSVLFVYLKHRAGKLIVMLCLLLAAVLPFYKDLNFPDASLWIPPAISLCLIMAVFHYCLNNPDGPGPQKPVNTLALVGVGVLFTVYVFVLHHGVQSPFSNIFILGQDDPLLPSNSLVLDLHHSGEQFTSALDFISGGKPFVTYFWPHGLSETGIIALAFKLMSRTDFPTMMLGISAGISLAGISILLIGYGMGLGYFSILVLSVLVLFNHTQNLSTFAHLFPVLLSFLIFTRAGRWYTFALSGAVAFMAHVYRIEYGVYGTVSILALCGFRAFASLVSRDTVGFKDSLKASLLFVVGILVTAAAALLILGWPDYGWYRTVFFILPKYHADATGFSYPLPVKGFNSPFGLLTARDATFLIISTLALLAMTTQYLYRNIKNHASTNSFFVLVVFLSIISLKTAFGRSDPWHIHQFFSLAYLLFALSFAWVIVRTEARPWLKGAVIGGFFLFFNFHTGSFGVRHINPHLKEVRDGIGVISEYNMSVPEQCSKGLFSKGNLAKWDFSYFDDALCIIKPILERHDVGERQLLVHHSASLLYPSLGHVLPTKYYMPGWAITEEMQKELVSELEKADIKAILFVKGFGAITELNMPDQIRLPIYYEWLEERFDPSKAISTPLGFLTFARDVPTSLDTPGPFPEK